MSQTFTSRLKASNLAEMFVLTYLLGKKLAPHENPPLTHFGTIKIGRNIYWTFHLVDRFRQNLVHRCKMKNQNCFADEVFFHIGHTFRINWYNKIEHTFSPNIWVSVTNQKIWTKCSHITVNLKDKTILQMIFFYLAHIIQSQFNACFKILNIISKS